MVNWDKICPVAKKFCPQQRNWTITLRSSLWEMRNCRFNLGDQNSVTLNVRVNQNAQVTDASVRKMEYCAIVGAIALDHVITNDF